jgi:thiol-disulfide isomerase/thioredoxin
MGTTMTGRVRAPELESSLGWLNTDRPLLFSGELRGQVVVLDFWTYCCINCIHVLPDLAFLEGKYAREPVTFIGVHSAKFSNEASRETIRAAILRYEIRHPVVIDEGMKLWRSFAVRSWPTIVVVDPQGYVVGVAAGEGNRERIDEMIGQALQQARATGTAAQGPLTVRREASVRAASGLAFPGKVYADRTQGRLFVADSNHNRIVVAEWPDAAGRARVVKIVGNGSIGRDDGPAEQARFHHPQGMVPGHGKLYVADTENHLIRSIDLQTYEVRTVAGTGLMDNDRAGGGMGTQQGLNSPWDLAMEGSTLYVAMAGVHQIWRIDLPVGFARALAGSGRENLVDGPTEMSALAQPSGICLLDGTIYVADSEVSAIRGIDLASEQVFTVIGEGLFSFGDVDGAYPAAQLQHPLGVAGYRKMLLVADTYNHKIKRVDPAARTSTTLFGTGKAGAAAEDSSPAFFEPGGLCVSGDELFVADTNNHRVVRVNLVTGLWHEIALEGLLPAGLETAPSEFLRTKPIAFSPGSDVELVLDVELPAGAHLNPEAPWSVRVASAGRTLVQKTGKSESWPLRIAVPASSVEVDKPWEIRAAFAYCSDGDAGICVPAEIAWLADVVRGGSGSNTVRLGARVTAD